MRVRTGYSFRTAAGHLPDVMARVKEIGLKAAPISDRCSTFGFTRWTKLAKATELPPVYGVELAVVPELGQKKPVIDYWTFFAKTELRALHNLIGSATANPGREPSLLYAEALAAKGVFKIAGERLLLEHVKKVPTDFFLALAPSTPKGLLTAAKKRKVPLVASSDNYYPRASGHWRVRITSFLPA